MPKCTNGSKIVAEDVNPTPPAQGLSMPTAPALVDEKIPDKEVFIAENPATPKISLKDSFLEMGTERGGIKDWSLNPASFAGLLDEKELQHIWTLVNSKNDKELSAAGTALFYSELNKPGMKDAVHYAALMSGTDGGTCSAMYILICTLPGGNFDVFEKIAQAPFTSSTCRLQAMHGMAVDGNPRSWSTFHDMMKGALAEGEASLRKLEDVVTGVWELILKKVPPPPQTADAIGKLLQAMTADGRYTGIVRSKGFIKAFSGVAGARANAALEPLLDEHDPFVRKAVMEHFESFGDAGQLPVLRRLAKNGGQDIDLRKAVNGIMHRIGVKSRWGRWLEGAKNRLSGL